MSGVDRTANLKNGFVCLADRAGGASCPSAGIAEIVNSENNAKAADPRSKGTLPKRFCAEIIILRLQINVVRAQMWYEIALRT